MNAFARPTTLEEATAILADGDWRVFAGGTDLYPAAASRLGGNCLDVTGIPDLMGIHAESDLKFGASATWSQIAEANLPPSCRSLQQAARLVGGRQIQNAGTIAGNLCNASPAADGVPPLLTLDAVVHLASQSETRSVPLEDFILGPRKTALKAGELVTAITVPAQCLKGRSAFLKLGARSYLVISIAMVAVRLSLSAGRIDDVAIAVGSCSAKACRLKQIEHRLLGQPADAALATISDAEIAQSLAPIDDIRATSDYRLAAAGHLVRRAIQEALA